MIKYFCDICEKEILNGHFTKSIKLENTNAATINGKHRLYRCCDACFRIVCDAINNIEKCDDVRDYLRGND